VETAASTEKVSNDSRYTPSIPVVPVRCVSAAFGGGVSREPLFFVASRGHHSEIGGITPGSMPPFSRTIEEEGIMRDGFLLVDRGRLCDAETRHLFTNHKYPRYKRLLEPAVLLRCESYIAKNLMAMLQTNRIRRFLI
jgi:N-methylhydantoinase B/oxoprolinase/acetone carboxylase alpha subunit